MTGPPTSPITGPLTGTSVGSSTGSAGGPRAGDDSWPTLRLVPVPPPAGRPPLSDEQRAVVDAPAEPLLVRAGAGSGKTHTVAARAARLVTGGAGADPVPADAVLGLTFTRKAAGELSSRLAAFTAAATGAVPGDSAVPQVSTYHAFAAAIVSEFGPHAGLDPDMRLVGEAAAAQIAESVVRGWRHRLDVDLAPVTVAQRVRALAAECGEHDVRLDLVAAVLEAAHAEVRAAAAGKGLTRSTAETVLRGIEVRQALLPLVRAYADRKAELGVVDHGDLVVRALHLVGAPAVGDELRRRHQVVFLDEYQDTSTAQGAMLAGAFGQGHPVTAVGDPNQAIFGWRGAGAGTLDRFVESFPRRDGSPPRVLELTVTRRNPRLVLDVANAVSAPLRDRAPSRAASLPPVPVLAPAAGAATGSVQVAWVADGAREAELIRDWLVRRRSPGRTQAVLCRTRVSFGRVQQALEAAGVPVTVVGLGGLLDEPVVSDVVALLTAAHDPEGSAAVMRLLTGPRWGLSAPDLDRIAALSRRMAAARDEAVLGDAVTAVADRSREAAQAGLTPVATARVRELAAAIRRVRETAARSPLPDVVRVAATASGVDVEAAVWAPDPRLPGRVLDRFVAVAADHADLAGVAGAGGTVGSDDVLGGFLAWLEAAREYEWGLETVDVDPDPDAVQILTVHAAKGLEWDDVVVTDLADKTFPSTQGAVHWLGSDGGLPWPVRGDHDALPDWPGGKALTGNAFRTAWDEFEVAGRAHRLDEERRLGYVALTRAGSNLLLTGSAWPEGRRSTPRLPSPFITVTRDVPGVVVREWVEDPGTAPEATIKTMSWPVEPPADVAAALADGAALVRAAMVAIASGHDEQPATAAERSWRLLVDRLVAEQQHRPRRLRSQRVTASHLVRIAEDPETAVRDLVRPVPVQPSAGAARGSRFHQWVERRFSSGALLDLDEMPGAADDPDPGGDLDAMQRRFEASEWADAPVVGVEVPFDMPLPVHGRTVRLRGRIDAVVDRGGGRLDVVDWKTGPEPSGASARARMLQLAVYRIAAARLFGVPPDSVGAAFWYARTGRTVRAADVMSEADLIVLIEGAYEVRVSSPRAGIGGKGS